MVAKILALIVILAGVCLILVKRSRRSRNRSIGGERPVYDDSMIIGYSSYETWECLHAPEVKPNGPCGEVILMFPNAEEYEKWAFCQNASFKAAHTATKASGGHCVLVSFPYRDKKVEQAKAAAAARSPLRKAAAKGGRTSNR